MKFEWNPNAANEIKRMAVRNMEGPAREAVEATVCLEPGKQPRLVRDGDELRIEDFCCRKVAEAAARNAGFGNITWQGEA